jgi:hypothetical protein
MKRIFLEIADKGYQVREMNDHLCFLLQFRRVNIIIEVGGIFCLLNWKLLYSLKIE